MTLFLAISTPVLAFLGSLLGQVLSRRSARELDDRAHREEIMRNLRWAAELATGEDRRRAYLGAEQLRALATSELVDRHGEVFVKAALSAVFPGDLSRLDSGEDD